MHGHGVNRLRLRPSRKDVYLSSRRMCADAFSGETENPLLSRALRLAASVTHKVDHLSDLRQSFDADLRQFGMC